MVNTAGHSLETVRLTTASGGFVTFQVFENKSLLGDIVGENCILNELGLAYGLPKPNYRQDEDFRVVIFRPNLNNLESTYEGQGPSQEPSACIDASVLIYCRSPKKIAEI